MGFVLGLKIDFSGIGYAGVEDNKVLFCGVHGFSAPADPRDGHLLSEQRGEARNKRRRLARARTRLNAVIDLVAEHGLAEASALRECAKANEESAWALRRAAFDRRLTGLELGRILYAIAKRRGPDYAYFGRREVEDGDSAELQAAQMTMLCAQRLQSAVQASGMPTVGAFLAGQDKRRNDPGRFDRLVTRDMLRSEIAALFAAQRAFGNELASESLERAYAGSGVLGERHTVHGEGVAFYQVARQSGLAHAGACSLEPGETRAPRHCATAERFLLWSRLNACAIRMQGGTERGLTFKEKKALEAAVMASGALSYTKCRSLLGLGDQERLVARDSRTGKHQPHGEQNRKAAERSVFIAVRGTHALLQALGENRDLATMDAIAEVLVHQMDFQVRKAMLTKLVGEAVALALADLNLPSGMSRLSLKAMRRLLPVMEDGHAYDEAVAMCGYGDPPVGDAGEWLPPLGPIGNAAVSRCCAQARKVLNALIAKYGMPDCIRMEVGRDLDEDPATRRMRQREVIRKAAEKAAAATAARKLFGKGFTADDVLKMRLWKEQNGRCPYTGARITKAALADCGRTVADRIHPVGRESDLSPANRVLTLTEIAAEKQGLTPFEAWGHTDVWKDMPACAEKFAGRKAALILAERRTDVTEWGYRRKRIGYAAGILRDHVVKHLAVSGGIDVLPGAWRRRIMERLDIERQGLHDRALAVDAAVISAASEAYVADLAAWDSGTTMGTAEPCAESGPPAPWVGFCADVLEAAAEIFVSRQPNRKVTGAAHEAMVRGIRKSDGLIVERVRLEAVTFEHLERMVDRHRNRAIYDLLKARLEAFGGKPDKAFAEPVFMPTKKGKPQGPCILGIRIESRVKAGVRVRGGLARNGALVRTDVFNTEKGFRLVPVYAHDFVGDARPLKGIRAGKNAEWIDVAAEDFAFSLYPDDLVRIETDKGQEVFAYYRGLDRSTGALALRAHNGNPAFGKKDGGLKHFGVRKLRALEKWSVNCLGEKEQCGVELRQ